MLKEEGSIYSLDIVNNSCKNGKKTYPKCTITSLSTLSLILFLCFLHCSFTSVTQKTFGALQFISPITQKSLNLVQE
jgi:hypothetical protein